MSSHFCPLPFNNIAFTIKGDARLCCDSYVVRNSQTGKPLNIRDMTASQIWSSPEFASVREQLLNNKRPKECGKCWSQEEKGLLSKRYYSFTRLNQPEKFQLIQEAQSGNSTLDTIEIRFGNACNQMCRTCDPFSSSTWVRFVEKHNGNPLLKEIYGKDKIYSYNADKFTEQVADILQDAKKIRILGGEPAVQPAVTFFLETIIAEYNAEEKEIEIVTNGTAQSQELLPLMAKFKHVTFIISIDGVGPVNEYIRIGSLWKDNINVLNAAICELPRSVIRVNTVVSAYNFLNIPQVIDWLRQPEYKNVEHSLIFVSDPEFQAVETLPLFLQEKGRASLNKILTTLQAESGLYNQISTYLKTKLVENAIHQRKFCEHLLLLDESSTLKCDQVLPDLHSWVKTIRLSPNPHSLHSEV